MGIPGLWEVSSQTLTLVVLALALILAAASHPSCQQPNAERTCSVGTED
jgi:hypothetical protein